MENEALIACFGPYIAPHKHFDIAMSKYGPLYVYPVDRKGESHEAEMLDGPKGIIETVVFQMICDVMEPVSRERTRPTKEELTSVKSRVQALLSGTNFESEALSVADQYIEVYKQYEW